MDKHLLELPAEELLAKFGAGEHKPGSGSAAALHGLLSAQLIRTVIRLTIDPKRRHIYKSHRDDILKADSEIKNRIYPELVRLFHEDSAQFDKAIKFRKARDAEKNIDVRKKLTNDALTALIPSTELPIEIAKLCIELANFAALIFDHGFKSARGDSGVAMSGAISSVSGCISIIDLNLLSFTSTEWTKSILLQRELLRKEFSDLTILVNEKLNKLHSEVRLNTEYHDEIRALKNEKDQNLSLSDLDIEKLVISFQRMIWKYRNKIWKNSPPQHPLEILDPEIISKIIGYDFNINSALGQHEINGKLLEVAGVIDNKEKEISISSQFSLETQRFTAFHELGHALMHNQNVLHRDRALDGSQHISTRDKIEIQADKFSAYFLMPKKQIEKVFTSIFLTDKFVINELTAFALVSGTETDLRKECSDLRALSRKLASTETYNGKHYSSLVKLFKVSVETMAIRLEELDLLEY